MSPVFLRLQRTSLLLAPQLQIVSGISSISYLVGLNDRDEGAFVLHELSMTAK
jgi:hypothetical protein